MAAESLWNSVVFRDRGSVPAYVVETDMVEYFVVHKLIDVKVIFSFLNFGIEWMLRNPTSRSLSVVCLVRMFPKWVFSTDVSSLIVLVFDFNLRVES